MKEIKRILPAGLGKLNNAEYTNLMTRTQNSIISFTPEVLGIEVSDFKNFQDNLALMNDLLVQSQTSDQTAQLEAFDKERDDILVYLLAAIRTAKSSPISSQRDAGTSLYNLTKPYFGTQALPNQQETAKITALYTDLTKDTPKAQIATLGLTDVLLSLNEANQRYATHIDQRTQEKATAQLEKTKNIRTLMDNQYDNMMTLVFVKSVATPTPNSDSFIKEQNALIAEINALYKQRIAQTKKKEDQEPSSPPSNTIVEM